MEKKGIYCIEGLWDLDDIKDRSSILPILDILEKREICNYIYHSSATIQELEFFLNKWKTKKINDKYPILYLAFHGEIGAICLNKKDNYTLDNLAELLKDKCSGKIIYFGSCSTLKLHKTKIKTFLKETD